MARREVSSSREAVIIHHNRCSNIHHNISNSRRTVVVRAVAREFWRVWLVVAAWMLAARVLAWGDLEGVVGTRGEKWLRVMVDRQADEAVEGPLDQTMRRASVRDVL